MGCGCKGSTPQVPKQTWTSADGKQTVTNLSPVQAKARQDRHPGSTVKPQ